MMKTEHQQIQELMATYADAIDAKDYDRLAGCFIPDAVATYGGGKISLKGPAEIIAHMKRVLDTLDGTQHSFSNFIVDVDGDAGKLSANMLAQHWLNTASGGSAKELSGGKYNVDVRRLAGKWKIERVAGRRLWAEGDLGVLHKKQP